jgi:hypothetical protein
MGFDSVLRQFADPPNRFRLAPFWFLNHELAEDQMRWQVREMHRQGAGGFVLHPRHGLLTEYLSEGWMRNVGAAIDEAKRLGMKAYLYDENNWPSGTCNARVIEENPQFRMSGCRLVQEFDVSGPARWEQEVETLDGLIGVVAVPLRDGAPVGFPESAVAIEVPDSGRQVHWDAPDGDWRIYVFAREFFRGLFVGSYLDTLNPDAVARFIELTHEVYAERFGEEFGDTIIGMFTDEPSLNFNGPEAIPWTPAMPGEFGWRNGYDLISALPAMFRDMGPHTKRVRCDLYDCASEMYANSYFKQIHDYCDDRRLALMGHVMWEGELLEHTRQQGDFFQGARYMHWGGCDLLCELTWSARGEMLNNLLGPKFASSAAHLLGKEIVMCECFGLASQWAIDLRNLKWMADWIIALGCNFLEPHAFYYSLQGFRKWECPPGEFYQSPFWPYYRHLADYAGRLCALFTGGRHVADVALLYPVKSLWAEMDPADNASAAAVVESFNSTSRVLLKLNYDFDIVPEEMLASEWFGRLAVEGPDGELLEEDYKALVLPACTTVSRQTAALLVQLHMDGVPIIATGRLPSASTEEGEGDPLIAACFCDIFGEEAYRASLSAPHSDGIIAPEPQQGLATLVACPANVDDDEMAAVLGHALDTVIYPDVSVRENGAHVPDIVHLHTVREGIHLFLFVNTSRTETHRAEIELDAAGNVYRLDAETGRVAPLCHYETDNEASSTRLSLEFLPTQAYVLAVDPGAEPKPSADAACCCARARSGREPVGEPLVLSGEWRFTTEKPNALPLRKWDYDIGARVLGRDAAIEGARYTATFEARHIPAEAKLLMDGLVVEKVWRGSQPVDVTVSINGQVLKEFQKGQYLDHFILEADLAGLLREGTNEVVIETVGHLYETPALRYPPILVGRFALAQEDGQTVLAPEPGVIPSGDWTKHGYPFYSGIGALSLSFSVPKKWSGKRIVLQFEKVGDLADIWLNGRHVATRAWEPFEVEITEFVKPGDNELVIKVANSLQNLFCDTPKASGVLGEVTIAATA